VKTASKRFAPWSVAGMALVAAAALAAAAAVSPPDVVVSDSSVGRVEFPHLAHVEDFGVTCVECHHETRAAALASPHPGYFEDSAVNCSVCHRGADGPLAAQDCSVCHHPRPASLTDEVASAKVAIHHTCWRCHEPATGAEASANCSLCHQHERSAAAVPAATGK